jgi:hypothetical protein
MHPTPPWHITNRKLVCLPLFWTTVIYTCRLLRNELLSKSQNDIKWPVDAITINFGQWESAASKEKYTLDCHGHAHFLLTLDFINKCDDKFFRPLKGRQEAPPNYLDDNTKLLEDQRLLSYEMRAYQQDVKTFLAKINEIQLKEAQRDGKIDRILALFEQHGKNHDDSQNASKHTPVLNNRYSYSHTSLSYSHFNPYSGMRYSYLSRTHESP